MWDGDVSANIPAYKEQFEVCPPGYRRPTDGYTDKISYNGYYDYLPDEGTTGTATNYKDQIEYSELRVSLFNVPFAGNAASSADYATGFLLLLLVELVIQVLGHILTEQTKICLPGNN